MIRGIVKGDLFYNFRDELFLKSHFVYLKYGTSAFFCRKAQAFSRKNPVF